MFCRKVCSLMLLLAVINAGCTTSISPTVKNIDSLTSGNPAVRKVGEPMVVKGQLKVLPGFRARTDSFLPKLDEVLLPMAKRGDTWECNGKTSDGNLVCTMPQRMQDQLIMADGSRPQGLHAFVFKPWGELVGLVSPTGKLLMATSTERFTGLFEAVEIPLEGTSRAEIIYDGRFDDMIKITYQEYGKDLSNPSYFKGISYNLSSLNTFKVKDTVIEVLDANENEIRFIIRN